MEDLIMKKHVVLFSLILFCLSGMAKDLGESWVVTNKGKLDCIKVKLGYNKARLVLENGQKAVFSFNTISSFAQNSKVFVKLPVYKNEKPTNQMAFMELIKTHGDLSLYKLLYLDLGSSNLGDKTYRYFIYNGKRLHLALDEKTLPNICLYFGLNYAEL